MIDIYELPVEELIPHPDNPRKDLGDLTELAESIRTNGIRQNLTVVAAERVDGVTIPEDDAPHYVVVIGHRRLAAAKLAGLSTVPCAVEIMDRKEQLSTMLLENMQRSDLTVYEQAWGFQQMSLLGCSVDEISTKSGFSKSTVRRRLKMAELDQATLKKISGRQLSLADFDRLAEIEDLDLRNKVLKEIGTNNFESSLNRAKNEDAAKKRLPSVIEWLKAHDAKEIDSEAANGRKYESLYCGKNRVYYGSLYLADKGEPKMPPDDGVKDIAISYVIALPYVRLYMPSTSYTNTGKKSREVLDREKLARETKAKLLPIFKEHYELRSGFVGRLRCSAKDLEPILKGAAMLTFFGATCYGPSHHSDDACKTLGITSSNYYSEAAYKAITEALSGKDYTKLAKAVYGCFNDKQDNSFAQYMSVAGTMPEYNASFNSPLRFLYDWLELLGYEPCDEERQMIDGTHPLYHVKPKKKGAK